MTKLEALKELAANVEAGKIYLPSSEKWDVLKLNGHACSDAFYGSLDAAKALHDAVLPWCSQYSIVTDPTCLCVRVCWWPDGLSGGKEFHGEAWDEGDAARAWLLAILRALIAQEEANA